MEVEDISTTLLHDLFSDDVFIQSIAESVSS